MKKTIRLGAEELIELGRSERAGKGKWCVFQTSGRPGLRESNLAITCHRTKKKALSIAKKLEKRVRKNLFVVKHKA